MSDTDDPDDPNKDCSKLSNAEKWWASIVVGIIFIVFASGPAFAVSGTLFKGVCLQTFFGKGGPTLVGLILHAIIVIIIARLAIENTNL
uniref:Transmembrane protein n=1 Tax=Pithovirus LCPAC103 TaxID=2506588 RepID=A0A481Z6M1_9VIRU|nr:MAG: hypothetical protein LCPAC103_00520 [Pithovirus LCPAC103]